MRWEHWLYTAPLRFRSLFRRNSVDRELEEELAFHLENKVAEGMAAGLSAEEARRRAMRAMGGLEQRKEEMRDARHVNWFIDFLQDARYALRSLRRTPAFTGFAVLTLALGIGVTSAIFSLSDALLLRPMSVPNARQVVNLVSTTHDNPRSGFSYPEYSALRDRAQSYSGVTAIGDLMAIGFTADPKSLPRVKGGVFVPGNFFRVLQVEPRIGRGFRPDEDQVPGRDAVVVISYDFWQREFGGDPSAIGRTVRLNAIDFTVIGVTPKAFTGTDLFVHPELYMPMAIAPRLAGDDTVLSDRTRRALNVMGRLKPGVSLEKARAEAALLAKNFADEYPKTNANRGASVYTGLQMRELQDTTDTQIVLMLGLLSAAVLLVSCANAASLLLSRARTRVREVAVRLAIGAGRFRLVRFLLTESLLIAAGGGCLGVLLGYAGVRFIGKYKIPAELPITFVVQMDSRVLLLSLAATLVCAIAAGLVPALQSSRTDLVTGLKAADIDVPGRRHLWGRNSLVVLQVAASFMLLTVAMMLVHGFSQVWAGDIGFSKDHLLMATFDPSLLRYSKSQTETFYKDLLRGVRNSPDVGAATLAENVPMSAGGWGAIPFVPEGFSMPRDRETFESLVNSISPGYFGAMRIPILEGRDFQDGDTAETTPVAIVNEQFAKQYWKNTPALGKRFRLRNSAGTLVQIVGITRVGKYEWIGEPPTSVMYLPLTQRPITSVTILARTTGPPEAFAERLRGIVRGIDPNQPLFDVRTMDSLYENRVIAAPLLIMQLVSAMGFVGLALSVAGLYALVTYNVGRKTREIGVRMAIGANRGNVLRMIMRQGLILVCAGSCLGLILGAVAGLLVKGVLMQTTLDLTAFLVVLPGVLAVTMLASYVPARRASRIAPVMALRYE